MISSLRGYMKQNCWYLRAEYYAVQHEEIVLSSTNCLEQIITRNTILPDLMLKPWFLSSFSFTLILLHNDT
jgi:hypothetical protein